MPCPTLRRNNVCGRELRCFLSSIDEQDDSSHQRQFEDWWNGHSVMFFCVGVNRPASRIFSWCVYVDPLISKLQAAEDDE
jgi:hypothetical protein